MAAKKNSLPAFNAEREKVFIWNFYRLIFFNISSENFNDLPSS